MKTMPSVWTNTFTAVNSAQLAKTANKNATDSLAFSMFIIIWVILVITLLIWFVRRSK